MAVTSSALPATELAKRAADKPLVIGRNLIEIAHGLGAASLVTNTTGTLAAGDQSAAGFDRRALTLRLRNALWKANAAGTAWYVVIDQGTTEEWVDALVIDQHNLDGVTVTVEADSTTPGAGAWAGATTVFTFAQVGTGLIFKLHATTKYKARYWRITLSKGSAFTPQAASIWLGKAVQFLHKSRRPFTPAPVGGANIVEHVSGSGVRTAYVESNSLQRRPGQQWDIAGRYKTSPSTDPEIFLYDLVDFWTHARSLNGGANAFWFCDDPTSAPTSAKLVYSPDPVLDLTEVGPQKSLLVLSTVEQGGV